MAKFIDLDLNFSRHPRTNDISKKVDVSAIIGSLKNIIKTANFESPFHPEFGCQVHSLLFEQLTSATKSSLERTIKYAIENFEPRVELISVVVKEIRDGLDISLTFRIVNLNEVQVASFTLERTL